MEEVIVAAGSNLGDRHSVLKKAGLFLESISESGIRKSYVWESEPVGPSKYTFLNSVAAIHTNLQPEELLTALKSYEQSMGRSKNSKRWGPRILDLDIIAFGKLVIQKQNLIIPHPEYSRRLFVLLPMSDITERWTDPVTGAPLEKLLTNAPDMRIEKTTLTW